MKITPPPHISKTHMPPPTPIRDHLRLKPKWWDRMYSRKAKDIDGSVWEDLLKPTSILELSKTITAVPAGKAPGYDGVSIDLLKLLCSNSKYQSTTKALLVTYQLRSPCWLATSVLETRSDLPDS